MSHRPACLLAFAALLVAAPGLATAHDRGPTAPFSVSVALPPVPPPWVVAALPPPAPAPWVQVSPVVYYGWLDANRAAFMARWGWNPWMVARYDGWYRDHRAGLDARFASPPRVVRGYGYGNEYENGHGRGHGWARGHDRDD